VIRMRGYPQHAAQEGGEAGVWFPHPAVLGNIYFLRPSQAQVWDGMLPQARARAGGPARAVVVPPARRACQGPGEGDVPVTALGGDVPRVTCGTHVGDVTAAPVQNLPTPRGRHRGSRRARERLCPLAHMSRRRNILLPFRGRPTRGRGRIPAAAAEVECQ